jgi:CHAD domain-containing protein
MKIPVNAADPATVGTGAEFAPADPAALADPELLLDASATAYDVAMAELARLVSAWRRHEPGARLGQDPEELHQLRVTARRIDATLGLFKHQLPPSLVRARKTTKALLRSLGATRDLDVQLSELLHYCEGRPEHERVAAEPLRARLESERARARARMIRALDSEPTRRWLETLTFAVAERGAADGGDPAMAVMPERVRRRFRKLRKSVGKLRAKSSMEDYHQVRRRAKQLRYATECGAVLFGKPADDLLKALRRLQDRLGAHQDAYMAQKRLAALAADPASGLPPATLFLMGRLAEQNVQITAHARDTVTRSWRKVRGKRWRALRTRLGQLTEAAADNGAHATAHAPEEVTATAAADVVSAAPHPSAPEFRPVKH